MLASQGLRRSLELAVLAALAVEDDYTNQVARRLRDEGLADVTFKQVSATLARLLSAESVSSYPRTLSSGQTLQHYRLTTSGRARLVQLTAEWTAIVDAMANLLG